MSTETKAVPWTPGPWHWKRCAGYSKLENDAGVVILDDGSACGEYPAQIDVNSPDARLISKAPTMAELLRELCRAITDDARPMTEFQHDALVKATRLLREIGGEKP